MALSPRSSFTLASSLSPPEILARDKEGFPPKHSVTFGEVVSSFNKFGSVASKRHGGVYISKEVHIPDRYSSIRENTMNFESRDALRQSPSSSRVGRSRTPSPWSSLSRRPRSLPATPRAMTPGRRLADSRREPWSEIGEKLSDAYGMAGSYADFRTSGPPVTEPVTNCNGTSGGGSYNRGCFGGTGGHLGTSFGVAAGTVGSSSGGTGGSSSRHGKARPTHCPSCGNVYMADAQFCRHCGQKRDIAQGQSRDSLLGAEPVSPASPAPSAPRLRESCEGSHDQAGLGLRQQAPLRPPPLWAMPSTGAAPHRDFEGNRLESWSVDRSRKSLDSPKASSGGNPRVSSFLRLNGFLLRTHITSLISALAEDGWLEAWEKDRLCNHARETDSSAPWAQTFLRIYMRFMESEDVPSFVASLRSQISV